jgi:hypothetical protein
LILFLLGPTEKKPSFCVIHLMVEQNPAMYSGKKRWYRGKDLNLHGVAPTST